MIKVQTSDGKIFDRDRVLIQIIQDVIAHKPRIVIDLNGEGPCCQHVGLYHVLDEICHNFAYPKHQIQIYTANFLEKHDHYQIIRQHQSYELNEAHTRHQTGVSTAKEFGDKFFHFGHFIGHANKSRLHLASYLKAHHADQTLQSYHCDVTNAYHREFIGLEDLMHDKAVPRDQITDAFDLLMQAPITLDPISQDYIGPGLTYNLTPYYPRFFVEIVSLTFSGGNTFYVDEKIWRPILMRTPFMVQGPANLVHNLHKLGFRTFHQWWDEGYSEDPDGCQVPAMIKNIQQLAKASTQELETMYNEMLPVLDHNLVRLLELTNHDFSRAFPT